MQSFHFFLCFCFLISKGVLTVQFASHEEGNEIPVFVIISPILSQNIYPTVSNCGNLSLKKENIF